MKTITLLLFCFYFHQAPPEGIDYRKALGSDYSWAENWISNHQTQFEKYARQSGLPSKELRAIIFPELVRYNLVFDAIQVESLKYLYVSEGKNYADFSVGYFQMKPSFAEMVEKDAVKILPSDLCTSNIAQWAKAGDNAISRRERVSRITDIDGQLVYLCTFYKICQQKFSGHLFVSPADRVRFFATCYNAGYNKTEAGIMDYETRKHFYTYNYSAVSAYYFETAR